MIDFLKMATMADIPLEKVEKMKPFLLKYSKQAGTLPMAATLCSTYIPRLFDQHFSALKQLLLESAPTPIHITADETTDCRDHSILNVLASFSGKTYLIDVVKMEACNHSTFSRAILKAVAEVELPYEKFVEWLVTVLLTVKKLIGIFFLQFFQIQHMYFVSPTS